MKLLALISSIAGLLFLVLAVGCGFAIHYGGKSFKGAAQGHMVLGVLALAAGIVTVVAVILSR